MLHKLTKKVLAGGEVGGCVCVWGGAVRGDQER